MQKSFEQIQEEEFNLATELYKKQIIKGPKVCKCGNKAFTIQKDASYKTSGIIFRCNSYKCKAKFNIRINSFFEKFSKITLKICLEVIRAMLVLNLNAKKAYELITNTLKENININTLRAIYKEIRNIICRYYFILYQSESLGEFNAHEYFSIDESLFTHLKDGTQIWVIGIINNLTKDFRLEATKSRDAETLEKFLINYIQPGNTIICDGWSGYQFIDGLNGFTRITHNHGAGDFGYGLASTSHIEGLWSILKSKIKDSYHIIPSKKFISFLREAEFKVKNRHLSSDEMIKEFSDTYEFLLNTDDVILNEKLFLSDSDFDNEISED